MRPRGINEERTSQHKELVTVSHDPSSTLGVPLVPLGLSARVSALDGVPRLAEALETFCSFDLPLTIPTAPSLLSFTPRDIRAGLLRLLGEFIGFAFWFN